MLKRIAPVVLPLVIVAASALAQELIPPNAGTIGLDGTIDKFYKVTNRAIVKTSDGVRHLVHLTGRTAVHGADRTADDTFSGLHEGSHVVVHCVVKGETKTAVEIDRVGDGGLQVVEGTVTEIDRVAKKLTVLLADQSWVTLRLTDHAAQHIGKDVGHDARVIVYYGDEGGEQVAHYFKRVS